jgi:hypothetical protein
MKDKINDASGSALNESNLQQGNNNTIANQQIRNIQIQIHNIESQIADLKSKVEKSEEYAKDLGDVQQKYSSFDERIKKIEGRAKLPKDNADNQKEKMCWIKKIPTWFWILMVILLCAILFIWIMLIFQDKYDFEISNNHTSIILTFVGIAATFVVVGNYAQVNKIEENYKNRIEKIEHFQNFLDQYQMGIHDHYQAFLLYNTGRIGKNLGLNSYRLFARAIFHFIECTGYNEIKENIETCLKGMELSIRDANFKEVDLNQDSGFLQAINGIRNTTIREFTDPLRKRFDEVEKRRIEREKNGNLKDAPPTLTGE